MAQFTPYGEYLTIQADPVDEKVGAIIVPAGTERSPFVAGTVVKVGDLAKTKEGYKPQSGERVIYNRHAAVPIKEAGEGIVVVKVEQLLGRVSK